MGLICLVKMVKLTLLDWVTFGVLFGIFVWLVLKTFGVINTPLWLQYAPMYGAAFAAGSFYYKMLFVANKVDKLEGFRNETIREMHEIKLNCARNHG